MNKFKKIIRKLKKPRKAKKRSIQSYKDEYYLIEDMKKCATRYLYYSDATDEVVYAEKQILAKRIRDYCDIKQEQLERKYFKNVGKPLFPWNKFD